MRLEAVGGRPVGDVVERRVRERGGQEAELSSRRDLASRGSGARRRRRRGCAIDVDPAPLAGAERDRVVDEHLVVAVGEVGVGRVAGGRPASDVGVDRPGRARRTCRRSPRRGRPGGPPPRDRPVPSGPGCGGGSRSAGRGGRARGGRASRESQAAAPVGAVDLPLERVLPAGADLLNGDRAARPVGEAEEDVAVSSVPIGAGRRSRQSARSRTSRPGRSARWRAVDERREVGHHRRRSAAR